MKNKKQIETEGYKITFTNGSGAGGQKRNRTYSVAVVEHIETGIRKRCDETRNANKNMNIAYEQIKKELNEIERSASEFNLNEARKKAIANGTVRTYDFKRGIVKNHLTGKEANLKKVLNGNVDLIQ